MKKVKGLMLIDKWNRKVVDNLDCDFKFDNAVAHIKYDIPHTNCRKHIIIPTQNIAYIEWFSNL